MAIEMPQKVWAKKKKFKIFFFFKFFEKMAQRSAEDVARVLRYWFYYLFLIYYTFIAVLLRNWWPIYCQFWGSKLKVNLTKIACGLFFPWKQHSSPLIFSFCRFDIFICLKVMIFWVNECIYPVFVHFFNKKYIKKLNCL